MKYKVYFGRNILDAENSDLLDEFNTMKEAESFVFKHIKENHKSSVYARIIYQSEHSRWYDYGSWFLFYSVIGN